MLHGVQLILEMDDAEGNLVLDEMLAVADRIALDLDGKCSRCSAPSRMPETSGSGSGSRSAHGAAGGAAQELRRIADRLVQPGCCLAGAHRTAV